MFSSPSLGQYPGIIVNSFTLKSVAIWIIGLLLFVLIYRFPGGTSGKEPTCKCRGYKRLEFNPWIRKIPWKRAWRHTPVFLPGESLGQRSLVGYSLTWLKRATQHIHIYIYIYIYIYTHTHTHTHTHSKCPNTSEEYHTFHHWRKFSLSHHIYKWFWSGPNCWQSLS